ncbi:MAG: UDP-N-acetylglucosamine 2-epimerase (non-hydrolyzing) [Clostridiales bacterium]|jgi:UDP-N-acetylglucosamine 2-epimerase (non-hydrolysing)/UDP-GlcNAc3NAcA epimerase|nr:UDP-N-acetylglucosamine 2-epimerase (non-hydrolyzing) [Clostridiales bacterium]
MKLCTIVGARPQFIKAAALSRVLRYAHEEICIHTGQHYDRNMSAIFFDELRIPQPDYNLGIAGGSHGKMTGQMLAAIEDVLVREAPDMALVYGDTNSTLAGALAAVKLHIPVCHVEAGVRMGTLISPEEVNRLLTDRVAALLCCCTQRAVKNLRREGITRGVRNTGDLMLDAALYYEGRLRPPAQGELLDFSGRPVALPQGGYYMLTCHREENTSDEALYEVMQAMQRLDAPAIYPVHPRNRERVMRLWRLGGFDHTLLTQPVGYLTSLYLVKHAKKVITDSGGLQREAFFYGVPCVTILDNPVWPETLSGNMNRLCAPKADAILRALSAAANKRTGGAPFGDGHAAEAITALITAYEEELCSL